MSGAGSDMSDPYTTPPPLCDNNSKPMPCLLLVLFLAFPRVAMVLMFFFSNYLQRAYHDLLVLVLGFVFLPLTTIVYAWLMNSHRHIEGVNVLILIAAVLIDVSGLGGGEYHRRR